MSPKILTSLLLAIMALALPSSLAAQSPAGGPPAAVVKAAPVVQDSVETRVSLTANAEPFRLIMVASRVEELVDQVLVEEGQAVEKDQPLVRMYQGQLKLRLSEARAALRQAQARLEQLERDLARKEALYANQSIPLKTLQDARTEVVQQQAVVQGQQAGVAEISHDLAQMVIKAPAKGVVTKRLVNQGEWVKKGGTVAELTVLDPLKVVVLVPERYLPHLKVGQEVCCTADAFPDQRFCGRLIAIVPQGDPNSRTFPVQVQVDNSQNALKPGMLIRVSLGVGKPHQALLVPKDALVVSKEGYSVFLIKQGKAQEVTVELVAFHQERAEIKGGLKAGDRVVVAGNERLRSDQPVRLEQPRADGR